MRIDRQGDSYTVRLDRIELRTIVNCLIALPEGRPDDYLEDLIGTGREGVEAVQHHLQDGAYEADRRHFSALVRDDESLSGRLREIGRELRGSTLAECGRELRSRAAELSASLDGSDVRREVFDRLAVAAVVDHIAASDGGEELLRGAATGDDDAVRFAVAVYWPGLDRATATAVLGGLAGDVSAPKRAFAAAVARRRLLAEPSPAE